jgi:hypothetical protein
MRPLKSRLGSTSAIAKRHFAIAVSAPISRSLAAWSFALAVLSPLVACPTPTNPSPAAQPASSVGAVAPAVSSMPHGMDEPAEPRAATPAATSATASAPETDASAEAPETPLEFIVRDAGTKVAGVSLATPCVDPSRHAAVTSAGDGGVVLVDAYQNIEEDSDLDGDGTNDLVVVGGASRWDVEYWIYLKRGSCGHFVARIGSSDGIKLLKSRTKGLADIKVVTDECQSLGGLGHGWCEIIWRFDGVKYVRSRERRSGRPAQSIP